MEIKELDSTNFKEAISRGVVVVDFWAPWCMPCKVMHPVFESVAKDFEGKVQFCKVNVDEQQELAGQYGIQSIPTIMIFKDGYEVDIHNGFMRIPELTDMVKRNLV